MATAFSKGPGLHTVIKARNIALKWRKGVVPKEDATDGAVPDVKKTPAKAPNTTVSKSTPLAKPKKPETTKHVEPSDKTAGSGLKNSTGLKMVFAMSDQREDQNEDEKKTIKVLTKNNNRLMENVITENQDEEDEKTIEPLPSKYKLLKIEKLIY